MLLGNWLDQAHKAGIVKVLLDAAAIAVLQETEVQWQISVLQIPQFWSYAGNNDRWRHSLTGEKILSSDGKMDKN